MKSSQKRNIVIQSDFIIGVCSVVDLFYSTERGTKSFEFIRLKNGFEWELNLFSQRYRARKESQSSNGGDWENDNNRKRTLEGSVSNVPKKRFKVMSTEDQFIWLLPEEMAEYVNGNFQIFLPEKGVYDSILVENPISSHVDQPQTVDDFIVPLMSKNETTVDRSFEKVQQKIVNVI